MLQWAGYIHQGCGAERSQAHAAAAADGKNHGSDGTDEVYLGGARPSAGRVVFDEILNIVVSEAILNNVVGNKAAVVFLGAVGTKNRREAAVGSASRGLGKIACTEA